MLAVAAAAPDYRHHLAVPEAAVAVAMTVEKSLRLPVRRIQAAEVVAAVIPAIGE